MGELFVGTLLHIVRLNRDSNKLMISMPGLDWELEGTQTVPMLNAAFDQIEGCPDHSRSMDDLCDESKSELRGEAETEYPVIKLLPHRERCFAQLRLFSLAEVLKANLGSDLVGIAFGIDEGMEDPLHTVLYWADEA